MTDIDTMQKVSEGNLGAIDICSRIYNEYTTQKTQLIFEALIAKQITGGKLWSFYKDHHGENIQSMVDSIIYD